MSLPAKCVVDTNVPMVANLATRPDPESKFPDTCVEACVEAIEHVMTTRGLILDAGTEIFDEYVKQLDAYVKQLAPSGQKGIGSLFFIWVHDHQWGLDASQRVPITRRGESYEEFPPHAGLENFDRSDRKFVAVSNAHPEKPPILQATDSKWWGWMEALEECGIKVEFLCPAYVEATYAA